ncbi:hypothetical protein KGA66_04780 [Actinocrinis puniceicyclus]|uniref:DsrE/DsrF-like family protein n=1 Tax=Actinocrinis puniceicyclus TaxID=977794 RepID=A0A8J8BBD5_9ACTN|nr:hypothetical protein [Actinocrinis puniceicyclus]MBS2962350.1 hypothetical protein [Actinocrinis puniceicyclus]
MADASAAGTLVVIERAHRGAVEQQYAHVLWLVHGLHKQSPMVVVLRGCAAVYALAAAKPTGLELGGEVWGVPPDYPDAIERLRADGAPVYVSRPCLERIGAAGLDLLPGVIELDEAGITGLAASCTRWWYL